MNLGDALAPDGGAARFFRFVAAIALFAAAGGVAAQDPRASEVQTVAREWLAFTDRLDSAASHRAAGARFRNSMNVDQWSARLRSDRMSLGAMQQRAVVHTSFEKSFPGVPDGSYALVVYRTAFALRAEAHETVTLEQESDGAWHVVGYSIR